MEQNTTTTAHISVIIPVYNETETINAAIRHLRVIAYGAPIEIIVCDGTPGHATLAAIEDQSVVKVTSRPGRGPQMNAGAAMARGDILLFLHADTRLPTGAMQTIRETVDTAAPAGAFSLAIDSPRRSLAVIAFFANLRTRIERIPYGDQAQFIRADLFRRLGGFADIPIMEDVELFERIRLNGERIAILRDTVRTSPRRWEKEGVIRRTLTNWWLRIRYAFGTPPHKLVRHYQPPEEEQ